MFAINMITSCARMGVLAVPTCPILFVHMMESYLHNAWHFDEVLVQLAQRLLLCDYGGSMIVPLS